MATSKHAWMPFAVRSLYAAVVLFCGAAISLAANFAPGDLVVVDVGRKVVGRVKRPLPNGRYEVVFMSRTGEDTQPLVPEQMAPAKPGQQFGQVLFDPRGAVENAPLAIVPRGSVGDPRLGPPGLSGVPPQGMVSGSRYYRLGPRGADPYRQRPAAAIPSEPINPVLPPAPAAAEDIRKLLGTWELKERQIRTSKPGKSMVERWVITPTHVYFPGKHAEDFGSRHAYRIDPAKNPKHIDFQLHVGNAPEGSVRQAIYSLDGDRLTVCFAGFDMQSGQPVERPTDMSLVSSSESEVVVFNRLPSIETLPPPKPEKFDEDLREALDRWATQIESGRAQEFLDEQLGPSQAKVGDFETFRLPGMAATFRAALRKEPAMRGKFIATFSFSNWHIEGGINIGSLFLEKRDDAWKLTNW